jgi:hypothetical protein
MSGEKAVLNRIEETAVAIERGAASDGAGVAIPLVS